ncbi:MAG: PEP-CTERM sorting domain-containing protein [Fimbriimonadia bacterium]|nr:PEP-CTERM sorting domain-containing protein [Fimbriimonadia bacterium]
MKQLKAVVGMAVAAALISASHASFTYNVIQSDVLLLNSMGSNPVPFVTSGPMNNFVDHLTGAAGCIVGNGTGNVAALVTIIYEVDTNGNGPVNQLDISILGAMFDYGKISWSEIVEDMGGNVLMTASATFKGDAYAGGADGALYHTSSHMFSRPVDRFKVKKTFVLDIADQTLPSSSIAALTLVEQNWVPEPASMIALSAGLVGLAARRRRK